MGCPRGSRGRSHPGVFATGDVRSGSVKRCAAAVGEGSTAVQLIHLFLAEQPPVEKRDTNS